MSKAIFLDRDGVVNELVYHQDIGIIDSPFTVDQFKLCAGASGGIRQFREMGYKVVLISNQPGIAKGHMSAETFEKIRFRMKQALSRGGVSLDADYYCFHHPEAKLESYRATCECRKPEPGLLLRAAREMGLDLSRSWMIGDGITDIRAGKLAGARTMMIGKVKCELCRLMAEADARPDAVCSGLVEAARVIGLEEQYPIASLVRREQSITGCHP